MLLLDHNLPHQLEGLLTTYGLKAETAASRGWERLRNGELVAAAHAAGFDTIFTRDRRFAESASKSLKALPTMALVVIKLPQRSWKLYADAFRRAWAQTPVLPRPGQVVLWP
jgi:alkanesulfonate monooxygenase SsuD/methylene tetrahydromethanopterin reductase-like flavin-dependent oxidoreductase (luciferase family)